MTTTTRITDQTIATVRERTDIVDLVRETVELTADGPAYRGPCSLHPLADADLVAESLEVRPDRQVWYCHSCQRGGDAVEWLLVGNTLGTFREAVEYLAERAGIPVEYEPVPFGPQSVGGSR